MYLQLRGWFDADFVTSPSPPASVGTAVGTSVVTGVGASDLPSTGISAGAGDASGVGAADSSAAGSSAGVGAASGIGSVGSVGTASGTSTVNGVGAVAPPYRVKVRNVTTGGSVGTIQIVSDTSNQPQEWLDINFPNAGGSGGIGLGVNALNFSGSDLGAKINNAFNAGNLHVDVPNASGLVITTPIKIPHAGNIYFSKRYPQHVICKTNDKPVFEAIGDVRHWGVHGGIFSGSNIDTPSCLLLCGRDTAGNQCGDTVGLQNVQTSEFWGVASVINIAGEVLVFDGCNLWNDGKGDSTWNGPRATVIVANRDYWGLPFAYTQPKQVEGSCSAITFRDCDIRCGAAPMTVGLIKGQVEDLTVIPTYSNSGGGRAHWLFEPGQGQPGGPWQSARRISIRGGGRSECNNAAPNPFILVDGLGQGGSGIFGLDLGPMSFFESSPAVIQTINAGRINSLNWHPTNYVWPEDTKLIDHRSASLDWATVKCRTTGSVDCTGQSINDSDIKIAGNVQGTVAGSSRVRAANFNNW